MYKTQKIIAVGIMVVLLVTSVSVVIRGDDPPGEGNGSQTYEYVIITSDELKNHNLYRRYYRDFPELEDSYPLPSNGFSFQALRDSRTARGLTAKIVTIEEIISNPDYGVNGKWGDGNPNNPYVSSPVSDLNLFDDTQAKIRNFIRFAHADWSTEYVLLGGNNEILPARYLYFGAAELYYTGMPSAYVQYLTSIYAGVEAVYDPVTGDVVNWDEISSAGFPKFKTPVDGPSDLYYSCLNGSFNYDMDDQWGESASDNDPCEIDEADLYAEVFIGRAPVDGWREVSHFVRKTLTYENSEDPYVRNVLMVGQILAHPSSHCQVEEILWGGKSLDTLVDGVIPLFEMGDYEPGDYTPIDVDARAQLPEGGEYVPPVKFTEGKGIPSSRYSIYTLYDRAPCAWGTPDSQGRLIVWPPNPNWGWPKETTLEFANNAGIHIINHLGSIIEYPKCSPIVGHFMKLKDKYLMNINWRYEDLPYYNIPDLMDFKNQDKPFFIYSQDCFAGAFDNSIPGCMGLYKDFEENIIKPIRPLTPSDASWNLWECPAETLITEDGGAFAAIMPSRHGWVGAGENSKISLRYNQEFWKVIFPSNKNDPHTTILSKANQLSKEALINHTNEKGMRWGYYGLNYFGDPALALHIPYILPRSPNKPCKPWGPEEGKTETEYTYTSTTTHPDLEDVYYLFDWGDGTNSGWLGPYSTVDKVNANHAWAEVENSHPWIDDNDVETYEVRVQAKDTYGGCSEWSNPLTVTIDKFFGERPETPSKPEGPTSGGYGIAYTYSTNTTDPQGDDVRYGWEWSWAGNSNGRSNGRVYWTDDFYPSGTTVSTSIRLPPPPRSIDDWRLQLRVKAEDINGAQSDFSSALTIEICYPNMPCDPFPANKGGVDLNYIDVVLSWDICNPNGDPLTYDVYFGTENDVVYSSRDNKITGLKSSALKSSNQVDTTYDPDDNDLDYDTEYYWQIVAKWNGEQKGPVWSFKTAPEDNEPPNIPITPIGPTSGVTNATYVYYTNTTDPDGDDVRYGWDWNGDGVVDEWTTDYYASGESVSTSHSWSADGSYDVRVKAEDENYAQSDWSPELTVLIIDFSENVPPVAFIDSICPNPADEGTSVYFVGHGEDSDGSITDYNWRSSKDGQLSKQSSFDISSLSSGTHTIYFKVKDNDDTWSPEVTDTLVINGLCNDPPTVPSQPCGPTSGTIETSYTYSTSATETDGDKVKYYFDWGDGTGDWTSLVNSAESASLSHTWNSAGTYYVKAKAIGEHGAQSDFSSELTVIICNEQNSNLDPDDDDDEEDTESKPSLFDLLCSLLNREINFVESIQQLLALIFT